MSTKLMLATATVAALASGVIVERPLVAPVAAQDRVTTLLAQVRTALGGEAALAAAKAISVEGPFKNVAGTRTMESYVSLLVVRPDKMRRSEESRFFVTTERITTFDGTQVWDEVVRGAGMGNGYGGGDHGGAGHGPGGAPGDHGGWDHDGQHGHEESQADAVDADAGASAEQRAAARVRRMKMDLQRWTLTFFADLDRPFTAAGRADSPDGPADLLETTDDAGRAVHYVIDAVTHLPLMVEYQQMRRAAPAVPGRPAAAIPPTKLSTVAMHLSDFRKVDGVMVPHQIDTSVDGRAAEAWTIETVKINPKVKPGTFKTPVK